MGKERIGTARPVCNGVEENWEVAEHILRGSREGVRDAGLFR